MEFILIIVVFIAIFWFMSRGQKKQQQQLQNQIANLEPGTWVMTTAGFYGRLIDIDGDVAILETADGTETYWLRQAISRPQEPPFGQDDDLDQADQGDETQDDSLDAARDDAGVAPSEVQDRLSDTIDSDSDIKDDNHDNHGDDLDITQHSAVDIDDKNFGKKDD